MSDTIEIGTTGFLDTEWRADLTIAERLGLKDQHSRIAVLIPCRNEEATVGKVVSDFQVALPEAIVYVYDNNSQDHTILEARAAGATVRRERLQGKGHVVRRMFADIEADAYVLVDGDDTYDPEAASGMVRLLFERQLDMVTAVRQGEGCMSNRPGHRFGNHILSEIVTTIFGSGVSDLLSGYRVFSRRFVKSFPAMTSGFETETEFTVHALTLNMPMLEVRATYRQRREGSRSKLHTVSDGLRIARTIVSLVQQERPLQVFGIASVLAFVWGIAFGIPVVVEFMHTGLVPRLPTAVLSTGLILLSGLSLMCGLILDAIARGRKELKRLAYLAIPPPVPPQ